MTEGKISTFNMWDYAMSDEEISRLTTKDRGNVISWDSMLVEGNPQFIDLAVDVAGKIIY